MSTLRSMTGAVQPLCGAIEAVAQGAALEVDDVSALVPALRAAAPAACPGAAADTVDVERIVATLRRHPSLLEGAADDELTFDPDLEASPRGDGPRRRAARAVVAATSLALEAKKLAFGLMAPPAALKAAFSTPDEARAILEAVAALDGRIRVAGASPGRAWSPAIPGDRELHVVAGAGARRVLDLLSPSVRRLRVELALLGRQGAVVDDDDVYRGLARLHDNDPSTVEERRARDAEEGVIEVDDGGGFVIDASDLAEDLVDRRARSLVLPLKKARVGIIGVVDSADLPRLLDVLHAEGRAPRTLQLLAPSTARAAAAEDGQDDGAVLDGVTGHLWPGASSTATLSLPWLGLAPPGLAADEDAFTLLQACAAAGLDAPLPPPSLGRAHGDDSTAALRALAAMVQVRGR